MLTNELGDKYNPSVIPTNVKEMIAYNEAIDEAVESCIKQVASHLGIAIVEMGDCDSTSNVREVIYKELERRFKVQPLDPGDY